MPIAVLHAHTNGAASQETKIQALAADASAAGRGNDHVRAGPSIGERLSAAKKFTLPSGNAVTDCTLELQEIGLPET